MNAKDERYTADEVIGTWLAGGPTCTTELDPREDFVPAFWNDRAARVCKLYHREDVIAYRIKNEVDGVVIWVYDGPTLMEPGSSRSIARIIRETLKAGYTRTPDRALFAASPGVAHYQKYIKEPRGNRQGPEVGNLGD